MSIAQSFLPEFEQEMASTRKVLERVPEDKFDWKAHPKSNTIGWVAAHLVEIPGWVEGTLTQEFWDVAPPEGPKYQSPKAESRKQLLELFDANVAAGKKALAATSDEAFGKLWSLRAGDHVIFTMPRVAVIRTFVLNHLIHHRGIMTVYLRLNDIAVPSIYGPSGDES